jgi:hypothetical protein
MGALKIAQLRRVEQYMLRRTIPPQYRSICFPSQLSTVTGDRGFTLPGGCARLRTTTNVPATRRPAREDRYDEYDSYQVRTTQIATGSE